MKKKLLFLAIVFAFFKTSAQHTVDIGISSGMVNYVGDLGNEKYFPISSASPGCQLTIRNFLKTSARTYKPLSMEFRLSWHRLQYDETEPIGDVKGMDLRNYLRGIGFRNDLFGASVNFMYTYYPSLFASSGKAQFCYFLLAGVGVYHGVPKADLFNGKATLANRYYFWADGTVRDAAETPGAKANVIRKDGEYETDLQEWRTEGQGYNTELEQKKPYNYTNIGIPLGAGIRCKMNKKVTLSLEFDYYYFFTDYLDDVSGRYATYKELEATFPDPQQLEMAKYISDPTGKGTNGFVMGSSPRGNPNKNDSFTFISFEVAYKLLLHRKSLWNNLSSK